MKDKSSRKLIFTNEELKFRFFLAKANDVPTYVEYGAADIGIVGKDTILEEGRKMYEVLDLKVGQCRMCVAGPAAAAELLKHGELIRVATKYPVLAEICPLSARMVVNQVSMKMEHERITGLINKLKELLKGGGL